MRNYVLNLYRDGSAIEILADDDQHARDLADVRLADLFDLDYDPIWGESAPCDPTDDGEPCRACLAWSDEDAARSGEAHAIARLEWIVEPSRIELTDDIRAKIVKAIEDADLESPEQVADLCIEAAEQGRDWRSVLAECAENG